MISSPEIGLARASDARRIALLSRQEIERGLGWSWTPARIARAIADRETNVIVARDGGEIAGFVLMKYQSDDAHLLLLAVGPRYRRKGLASAMLQWLEETLRVAGITRVQVEVRAINRAAQAFYAKLGFEPVQATHGYYRGVETALHLVKELAPAPPP